MQAALRRGRQRAVALRPPQSERTRRTVREDPLPSSASEPDDVELRLASLARSRGALRRALAALAGRFVALRGWERLGFARLGDYATERLGLSARELQDLARGDAALRGLPRIEAALVAGRITWTHARLLARVASPADEERWLAFARSVPARELARHVRTIDAACVEAGAAVACTAEAEAQEEVRQEGICVRCTPEVRVKWHIAWRLARRVAGEALPLWACMEAVAAEVLSALPLDAESAAPLSGRSHPDERAVRTGRRRAGRESPAQPVARGADASLASDLERADAFELDARLRRAVRRLQQRETALGPLLREVAERRLYRLRGFANLDDYARQRLDLAPSKARALIRIERAAGRCPAVVGAYRAGRLSWVQVQALLPLALAAPECEAEWVGHAERVSVRRLRDDVADALACIEAGLPLRLQTGAQATAAGGTPPAPRPALLETARFFFTAPSDVARLFRAVVCSVRRRLPHATGAPATEGEAIGAMLDHAIEAWGGVDPRVPRAHRVFARDGWRCTAPGCSSFRNLHDHHIVFRSAGGSDALSNRTTLCAWHHLRGVHGGIVRCTGTAPDGLHFAFGLRRGRAPLASYGPGETEDTSMTTAQ